MCARTYTRTYTHTHAPYMQMHTHTHAVHTRALLPIYIPTHPTSAPVKAGDELLVDYGNKNFNFKNSQSTTEPNQQYASHTHPHTHECI